MKLDKSLSYYIDFDGVILDTMPIYHEIYVNMGVTDPWEEVHIDNLENIINIKYEINKSTEILKYIEDKLDVTLLTKYNTEDEKKRKIEFLQENDIHIPVIFVRLREHKIDFVKNLKNSVLIDDDLNNIEEWDNNGGKAILFSKTSHPIYETTYNLDILKEIV